MPFIISTATIEDAAPLHQTMLEAFQEYSGILFPPSGALTTTLADTRTYLELGEHALIVYNEKGAAVGSARYQFSGQYVYSERLAVLPAYRGQGICRAMLAHIEQLAGSRQLTEARLAVRHALPQNLAAYQKLQYAIIETHQYDNHEDGWFVMSKRLAI